MAQHLLKFERWFKIMQLFNRSHDVTPLFDASELNWAWSIASSRSADLEGDLVIVPVMDFLNHAGLHQCNVGQYVSEASGMPSVIALTKIAKGDELYLSYGAWDNLKLLIDYGFVLSQNVLGPVIQKWQVPPGVMDMYSPCSGSVERHSGSYRGDAFFRLTANEGFVVSEAFLLCGLLTGLLKSPGAGAGALQANYSKLLGRRKLPQITCKGGDHSSASSGVACKIRIAKRSVTVSAQALHLWLQTDFEWVRYIRDLCIKHVQMSQKLNHSSSWRSLQEVTQNWSQHLVSAVVEEQVLFHRCSQELDKRLSQVRGWQQILQAAISGFAGTTGGAARDADRQREL